MTAAHCPECGEEVNVRSGATTTCGACGTRIRIKNALPAESEGDVDEPPMVRPAGKGGGQRVRGGGDSSVGCPECGSRYVKAGPWPWYLGTIGAMVCKAMICEDCGHEFDAKKPQADFHSRKRNLAIIINGIGLIGIIIVLTLLYLAIRESMKR